MKTETREPTPTIYPIRLCHAQLTADERQIRRRAVAVCQPLFGSALLTRRVLDFLDRV